MTPLRTRTLLALLLSFPVLWLSCAPEAGKPADEDSDGEGGAGGDGVGGAGGKRSGGTGGNVRKGGAGGGALGGAGGGVAGGGGVTTLPATGGNAGHSG